MVQCSVPSTLPQNAAYLREKSRKRHETNWIAGCHTWTIQSWPLMLTEIVAAVSITVRWDLDWWGLRCVIHMVYWEGYFLFTPRCSAPFHFWMAVVNSELWWMSRILSVLCVVCCVHRETERVQKDEGHKLRRGENISETVQKRSGQRY